MNIKFGLNFRKKYQKAETKIKTQVDKKIHLFLQDPFHPLLNNHVLQGKYLGYRSINITGDWRGLYKEYTTSEGITIIFLLLGTHSQLYK